MVTTPSAGAFLLAQDTKRGKAKDCSARDSAVRLHREDGKQCLIAKLVEDVVKTKPGCMLEAVQVGTPVKN